MDTVGKLRRLEDQLAREGDSPSVLLQIARVWRRLGQPAKALTFAQRSLALESKQAPAWNTLGAVLMDLERWQEAETAFVHALRLDRRLRMAEDNLALALTQQSWQVHSAAQAGDWEPFDTSGERLLSLHRARMEQTATNIIAPFSVLGFCLSAEEQQAAAKAQASAFALAGGFHPITRAEPRRKSRRLRIGYLSADFRDNAAGHLLHRLFECHNRDEFEVYALSYGPEDGSDFRRQIRRGVEHFVELRDLDDEAAARRIAGLEIDIMLDLMGFAGNHRAGILARRPAPLQVLYLGYCMTTGAPWIDAFIADRVALPVSMRAAFTEQVIYLPHSYQVYSGQAFSRGTARRREHGLPETAFVFACFNMPEKADPVIFGVWMKILQNSPGSILWLLCPDASTLNNYRDRARSTEISPERIMPAPLMAKHDHLARLELADLFLDTPHCNAHTTASDALWAGVPVLTCPGELFAQRVAASVCCAAGLPDLIVDNLEEYAAVAIDLAATPKRVKAVRRKLADARPSAPLFDVARFAHDFESALSDLVQQRVAKTTTETRATTRTLPLVLVLGCWRSGTSALAGLLHYMGVYMGEDFGTLRADCQHRNTFEPTSLFEVVWSVFREPDMAMRVPVVEAEQRIAAWLEVHHQQAVHAGATVFGVKHPALSLLVPQIKAVWPQVLTVRTERSLDTCLDSMRRAGWEWPRELARAGLKAQSEAASKHCDGPGLAFPDFVINAEQTITTLTGWLPGPPETARIDQARQWLEDSKMKRSGVDGADHP